MEILNISAILDRLVSELPSNKELQSKLGLISSEEEPFAELGEIVWNCSDRRDKVCNEAVTLANQMLAATGDDDFTAKELLEEIITLANRRLMLRQVVLKKCGIDTIPHDLLRAYAESAENGWSDRVDEIIHRLSLIESRRHNESEKLAKLFR